MSVSLGRHRLEVVVTAPHRPLSRSNLGAGQAAEVSFNLQGLGREPRSQVDVFDVADNTGVITGIVSDESGARLTGVTVRVPSMSTAVTSSEQGRFELELPRGNYALEASRPKGSPIRISNVRALGTVSGDSAITIPEPSARAEQMEEMVVVGQYVPSTALGTERDSDPVLDVISQAEISLAGDSTALQALQRVTGVTIKKMWQWFAVWANGIPQPSSMVQNCRARTQPVARLAWISFRVS
ncbi:MAG: carboxypeptidase-like regulatory domain-containing protein [Gammaproteobacteria bacterium]|nr:carboxypeptidase-like regulatory domain-containing protein [Gammaproteobacteria bacterium]